MTQGFTVDYLLLLLVICSTNANHWKSFKTVWASRNVLENDVIPGTGSNVLDSQKRNHQIIDD